MERIAHVAKNLLMWKTVVAGGLLGNGKVTEHIAGGFLVSEKERKSITEFEAEK